MKRLVILFSLETIAFLLLVGCSSNQSKTEQSNGTDSLAIKVDSVTLYSYYLNLRIESLRQYDSEARDQIMQNKKVDETLGYLEGQVVAKSDGFTIPDNFTIRIQKINSDEAVAVHSSGIMGGGEFGSDDFQVFQKTDSGWQTNKEALSEITLSQFYQAKDIPDAPTYRYKLDPTSQELRVELTIPDHYLPHMTGEDSASQAFLKILESNKYSELVMNWDKVGHKFRVKDRILKKVN